MGENDLFFIADVTNMTGSRPAAASSLSASLAALSLSSKEEAMFHIYNRDDAVAVVRKALMQQHKEDAGAAFDFNVFPGQELFQGRFATSTVFDLPVRDGHVDTSELKRERLKPFFNSFPRPAFHPGLARQLNKLGFHLIYMDDQAEIGLAAEFRSEKISQNMTRNGFRYSAKQNPRHSEV